MRVCAISFKPCWQDDAGRWWSDGGFPLQMSGIRSLFEHMTLIITRSAPGKGGIPLPADADVVTLPLPDGFNLRRKLSFVTHIPRYICTLAPHIRRSDVVHLPLPGDIPFLGIVIALVMRKRVIVRYGSSWAGTSEETMMTSLTKRMMRRFAGGRNVMITTGEGEAPPAEGVHWIFSTAITGDELRAIPANTSRGLRVPARIAYIGRLSAEKGVAHLIGAFAELRRRGFTPMPHCSIIGDGPLRRDLEQRVAAAGLGAHFVFTGQLDRGALSRLIAECDFCVQPSLSEGFSKAWLDAFVHGLPVLATNVGAAAQVIGGEGVRGWLVPPGETGALADALARVITGNVDWPALRARCRQYTEKRTLEIWAQEIGRICAAQWNMRLVQGRLAP